MVMISLGVALMSICAYICIPAAVPFTLQTFGVFLLIGLLGGKRATIAILIYLLLGALGVPVFSLGSGGIGVLFGSAGGYMMSWIFIGLLSWAFEPYIKKSRAVFIAVMLVGLLLCYVTGTLWYVLVYARNADGVGYFSAMVTCVFPFIIPDVLKLALAAMLQKRLARFL